MTSPDTATRRIFRGLGLILGGKVGAGLISLVSIALAARTLGPRDYGVLVLMHGYVTAVCAVIEFPTWQAVIRYGAQAETAASPARLARLLRFSAALELLGGLAAIAASISLVPIVGPRLGWPPEALALAAPYSLALLGSVRSVPAGYLQLVGRFDLLAAHSLVQPLVRLVGASCIFLAGGGLDAFLIAWLLAAIAEFSSLWIVGWVCAARRLGPDLHSPSVGNVRRENSGIWRFLIASNADLTLGNLAARLAPLVVGWILGPAAAGLYAIAQRTTVVIAQPAQMLGNTAYAELSRLVAVGNSGEALRSTLIRIVLIAFAFATPVLLLTAVFSREIVQLMAGPSFLAAASMTTLLMAARVVALPSTPCSAALSAMGFPGQSVRINLLTNLASLLLLPWLLHGLGLPGSGIQAILQAAAASICLVAMVWQRSAAK